MGFDDYGYNFRESTGREEELAYIHREAWREYDKAAFHETLHETDDVTGISELSGLVDFYIGSRDVYPERFEDDHLDVTGRSSVSWSLTGGLQAQNERRFVGEVNIHLPPTHEKRRDDIDSHLDLPANLDVYYGTGALGGMPAPDGVITPHIHDEGDYVTYETVETAIEQAIDVYKTVYESGKHAIKQQP